MPMSDYTFFQNKDCKYFPCHSGVKEEDFSCMFCYCPLYALGDKCGGNFSYANKKGVKDCSNCTVPHRKQNYERITDKSMLLIEMVMREDLAVDTSDDNE